MGKKPVRCIHCGVLISLDNKGKGPYWIHYPVRKGIRKGLRFYGCGCYKEDWPGKDSYVATPPEKASNA